MAIGNFMKLWMQDDESSRYLMQKALNTIIQEITKKRSDVAAKLKVGKPVTNPEYHWLEEIDYPDTIVGTFNGTTSFTIPDSAKLFGNAVTADYIKQVLRVGTILERPAGGGKIKVTDITGITDGSPYVAVVAKYPSNATVAADGSDVAWNIISETITDYTPAGEGRSLPRYDRLVGSQIHSETFEIPRTRENTKYEGVNDETQRQIMKLMNKLRRQLGHAVLKAEPYWTGSAIGYGLVTDEPTMLGLLNWPKVLQSQVANTDVYVDANGARLTQPMLDQLIRNHWLTENADFDQGDWAIICNPLVHEVIHDFMLPFRNMTRTDTKAGWRIDTFESKIGKSFPIISDQYIYTGTLQLVDFSRVEYRYFQGDQMSKDEVPMDPPRVKKWQISFQTLGVIAYAARQSVGAQIYDLGT